MTDSHALSSSQAPAADSRLSSLPDSELRALIAKLWSQALGIKNPGVHDNFFDLGGHSLLLPNLHAEMQAALGQRFPLVKLLENPTIASLANFLERTDASAD